MLLQLQRPPVLLLRAHAAYKTLLWKLQPFCRTRGECLAVNKLPFPINRKKIVDVIGFRISHKGYRSFTKMSAKRQQNRSTHEYKLPSAAISLKVLYSAIPRNFALYIQEQDTSPMKVDSSVEPFTKLVAMLEQGMACLS